MTEKLIEKNGKKYLPTGQEVTDIVGENHYIVKDEKGFQYGTDISGEYMHGLEGCGLEEFEDDYTPPEWLKNMAER